MKRIQKAAKKKLREHNRNLTCHNCGTTSSPLWRRTPDKLHNLCNACGLYYKEHKAMRPANKIARKPAGDFGGGTVEITAPNPASYTFPRPAQIAASQAAASQAAAQSTAAQSYYVAANAASSSSNATLFYTAPDGTQGFFQPSQQVGYDMPMMRAAQDYVAAGMGGGVAASKLPLPSPDEFLQQSREAAGVLQQPLSSYYTSQQYQVSGSNESGSQ
ncbi:hypothetical protein BC830DRAFT_1099459 [Chytriomyces sp. MP71]|nr:hypothetical protein BC830DRAFT_1099459 [Chytriomyces sp. MP71]